MADPLILVNPVITIDGTDLKWVTPAGGATWGSITGTLSSQTDLNTALNARVSTAGDTMDNNALLEFNDTVNLSHLGINGNGVTVEGVAGLAGLSANLNMDRLSITDGTDTAEFGLSGIEFADGTTQTTAYTGGATYLGDRISIYSGYLYNEDTSVYVSTLTLQGASTVDAKNLTLQASGGGVLTFSDATTQSTAAIGIPSGGATGAVLTKNSGTNYDASWVAPSGCVVNTYGSSSTSGSFTWTKPTGAKWVEFYLVGGGGGGGSGTRQSTATNRCGGASGAGGTTYQGRVNAAYLGGTETVVVGAGGAGGAVVTANSTNGNNGSVGTSTTFSIFKAVGGNFGAGGSTAATSTGGVSRTSMFMGLTSSAGAGVDGRTMLGADASNITNGMIASGGGAGGGQASGNTNNTAGGAGGSFTSIATSSGFVSTIAGGSGGTAAGVAATNGTSVTSQYPLVGTGGGGGYYRNGVAGGTGGNGGWPGGGAGGGGSSDNGFDSGKGGDGGNGLAVIITYF